MNNIFVDTETFDIPYNQEATYKDIDNWPDIRQISWIITDKDFNIILQRNYFTKYLTSENEEGQEYLTPQILPIHHILKQLLSDIRNCDVIIGHNIEYDVNVIASQLHRYGLEETKLLGLKQFCTMHSTVEFCGFDTMLGDRFPKLQELYSKLFSMPFNGAHDAYNDIKATYECTNQLFKRDILSKNEYPFLYNSKEKEQLAEYYFNKGWEILVGHKYGSLKDTEKFYIKAVELGHIESMNRLGGLHAGIPTVSIDFDFELAKSWYLKAIEKGNYQAYSGLSLIYGKKGDIRNKEFYNNKFIAFKRKEFENNIANLDSLNSIQFQELVVALMNGNKYIEADKDRAFELAQIGIKTNKINPHYYAKILKERGDKKGYFQYLTADLEMQITSFKWKKQKQSQNFYWWENRNFCEYLTEVAICYYEGIGIERDLKKSYELLLEGYQNYNEDEKNNLYLGKIKEIGIVNCPQNYLSAVQHYEFAKGKIAPEAFFCLALLYKEGKGVKKDVTKAKEYAYESKKNGYTKGVDEFLLEIKNIEKKLYTKIAIVIWFSIALIACIIYFVNKQ